MAEATRAFLFMAGRDRGLSAAVVENVRALLAGHIGASQSVRRDARHGRRDAHPTPEHRQANPTDSLCREGFMVDGSADWAGLFGRGVKKDGTPP